MLVVDGASRTAMTDADAALAQTRQARARLAALGFFVDELPGIDRWLASVK